MSELWVFGYGSLMWRPGFPFEAQAPGLLKGAHRALCTTPSSIAAPMSITTWCSRSPAICRI